jgi:hypothetical protein
VVEYHEDHTKNKHYKKDVSHLRHCYLVLALSTPVMNRRPSSQTIAGDRTPAIFSATPARDSFAGHCSWPSSV